MKNSSSKQNKIFNLQTIIFLLLIIYLLYQLFVFINSDNVKYFEVVEGTNEENVNDKFTGIALRNEKVSYAESDGYIEYFVSETSRVSKNTTLYSIDSSGELDSLLSELSEDNDTLSDSNLSDLNDILYDFVTNYDDMDFSDVYNFKGTLTGAVIDLINMKSLKKLASNAGENFSIEKSENAGIVLFRTDGYESLKPKKITADFFDGDNYSQIVVSSGDQVTESSFIYSTVGSEEWKIVIQLSDDQVKTYKKTSAVSFVFSDTGVQSTANFKIITGSDGEKYGVLTTSKYMLSYITQRFIDIEIINDSVSGLKIPKSSLISQSYYIIPTSYGKLGGNSGSSVGFMVRSDPDDASTASIDYPDIFYQDDDYYYISVSEYESGTVIDSYEESGESYTISDTRELEGVYNINNGYTMFVMVEILYTSDEYYLVSDSTSGGLSIYDRIALNADDYTENQIIIS